MIDIAVNQLVNILFGRYSNNLKKSKDLDIKFNIKKNEKI